MNRKFIVLLILTMFAYHTMYAQSLQFQEGILFKSGTSLRIGSVKILNKRTLISVQSNIYGVFKMPSDKGDTLQFISDSYQTAKYVVSDFTDQVIYMNPIIQLEEVQIKENSLKSEIKETQSGYRKKSVFYTGTPHYYYLFLKPMTFIYENFKSEVKDARRFNRYARKELADSKVYERFNDKKIKSIVPISEAQLENFEWAYQPTLKQIDAMNDYDLVVYIKKSYQDFLTKK